MRKTYNDRYLEDMLLDHTDWLKGKDKNKLVFYGRPMCNIDFSGLDLSSAIFENCDLTGSDFSGCTLNHTNFRYCHLSNVNFSGAKMNRCDISGANLIYANLVGADIKDMIFNHATSYYHLQCPEKGSFIGYKKCDKRYLIELLICEDAYRTSATSRKCSASKVKVLDIIDTKYDTHVKETHSTYDSEFIYIYIK